MSKKVIIVGGGICGLAIAWELILKGGIVSIYEKKNIGCEATKCSGGMLAAGIENEPSEIDLWKITKHSQILWKKFRQNLEKISNIDIDYRHQGIIMIATNQDDLKRVQFLYNYQKKIGVNVQQLSAKDIKTKEPRLKTVGGIICTDDHQVNSIALTKALKIAILKKGGTIFENTTVKSVYSENNVTKGIILKDDNIVYADAVVICSGVNSNYIKGVDEYIPVRPVKGQMLELKIDKKNPLLTHVIWTPRTYLIPKSNGTMLIGATVEEQGLNKDKTVGALYALLNEAYRALPAIENIAINKIIVGHRPTSRDDAPIIGQLKKKNLYIATGHHRNGILLAPSTGKIMADLIIDNKKSKFVDMFNNERFIQ